MGRNNQTKGGQDNQQDLSFGSKNFLTENKLMLMLKTKTKTKTTFYIQLISLNHRKLVLSK